MTRIVQIDIGGQVAPWEHLGLGIADAHALVGNVALRFVGGASGIRRVFVDEAGDVSLAEIDGAPWGVGAGAGGPVAGAPVASNEPSTLGVTRIDHLVLMTSDLERTCGAIEQSLSEPLKRIRQAGDGVQQGFFRFGEVIVEVVESPKVPPGPALWWGLVLVVADIHQACGELGPEVISLPRHAVQPGRLIASVRQSAGLGTAVALMSD